MKNSLGKAKIKWTFSEIGKWRTTKDIESNEQIFTMKFPKFMAHTERAFYNMLLFYMVLISDMFWRSYCCSTKPIICVSSTLRIPIKCETRQTTWINENEHIKFLIGFFIARDHAEARGHCKAEQLQAAILWVNVEWRQHFIRMKDKNNVTWLVVVTKHGVAAPLLHWVYNKSRFSGDVITFENWTSNKYTKMCLPF